MGEPDRQLAQSYLLPFPFLVAVCQPSSESDDEDCCVGAGAGGPNDNAWDCCHAEGGPLAAPR